MSCALAAGESFGAFVVPKPGKVVYVVAEGVSGPGDPHPRLV